MKSRKVSIVMLILFCAFIMRGNVLAASIPKYHDIPAYQQKDIFETERVKVSGINIEETTSSSVNTLYEPVTFEIFNCTTQQMEYEVVSENGQLPEVNLVKDHNYIIFSKDTEYSMENMYIWMRGNVPVDIKQIGDANNPSYDYPEVKSLRVEKRKYAQENPEEDKRVMINLPVRYGEASMYNVSIRLVSAYETVETTSGNRGYLRTTLIEDIPYIVIVEHEKYGIEMFPLVVKDKSEYGAGKYTYDFSSCKRVESIQLVNKEESHKNDETITSLSGDVTVSGMNFKDILAIDSKLEQKLGGELKDKDYEVRSIILVNPHRWEIGRFAVGNYKVTIRENADKKIKNLYYLDEKENLTEIAYEKADQKVTFMTECMSISPIVIEYESPEIVLRAPKSAKAQLSGGYDDVKFTWEKVKDASGYHVYFKKASAKNYTSLGRTTKLSYTKKNLADGVKYIFKVVPYYKKDGVRVYGKYAKTANVYTLKKLNAPTLSKVNSKKVKVRWTNIQGESGYQISRSLKKTQTNIVSTYATTSGKTKTLKAVKNKTYYYKVRAYKTVNGKKIFGPWSNVKAYKLK